jgi:hypothetical protein
MKGPIRDPQPATEPVRFPLKIRTETRLLYDAIDATEGIHPNYVVNASNDNEHGAFLKTGSNVYVYADEEFVGEGRLEQIPFNAKDVKAVNLKEDVTVAVERSVDTEKPLVARDIELTTLTFFKYKTTTYDIKNQDRFEKTLWLRHPVGRDWELVRVKTGDAALALETLVKLTLCPGSNIKLTVVERNDKVTGTHPLRTVKSGDLKKIDKGSVDPETRDKLDSVELLRGLIESHERLSETLKEQLATLSTLQEGYVVDQSDPLNGELLRQVTIKKQDTEAEIRHVEALIAQDKVALEAALFGIASHGIEQTRQPESVPHGVAK